MYREVMIRCKDCGKEFTTSAEDHEFYAANDLPLPESCPVCQTMRKTECNHDGERWPAQAMHDVVCAKCGKRLLVYNVPAHGRPVYCIDCVREITEKL